MSRAEHRLSLLPHSPWETKCPFDYVVAYEDTATRNRVFGLYDYLAQNLFSEFEFRGSWYRFQYLQNGQILQRAIQDACRAHMVIISLRQGRALPRHVIRWIECWSEARGSQKSALVSLVANEESIPQKESPMQQYLHRVARASHMDFFAHNFEYPATHGQPSAQPNNIITSLADEGFMGDGATRQHSGINE